MLGIAAFIIYGNKAINDEITSKLHHYESKKVGIGHILYKNIALDADAFHTIETLYIKYNLLKPSILTTIQINGLRLDSVNLKDINALYNHLSTLPVNNIKINNAKASFLHEKFGGVSLRFDINIRQLNRTKILQGRLETIQKNLGFQATFNLQESQEEGWQGDIEIQNGKLTFKPINLSRLNGIINLRSDGSILSNFKAGGGNFHNIPWANINGAIEWKNQKLKGFLDANALKEAVELTVSMNKNTALITLYSESESDMKALIEKNLPNFNAKINWEEKPKDTGTQLDFLMKMTNPKRLYYRPK